MDKKHEELNKHLNAAISWLSKIPVHDVFVDYMAMARQEIRTVQAAIQKENKNTEE